MRLIPLEGNRQRLDGGSLFGNAPRMLWQRWVEVDDLHRITLACRALLIQLDDGLNVLLETGIGAFFSPDMKHRFGVLEEEHRLLDSLAAVGLSHGDIDYVILSHLHFDHAGGLMTGWEQGEKPRLLFPKAQYVVSEDNWRRACDPHPRDRASFIPELQPLLEASHRLRLLPRTETSLSGLPFTFHFSDGHTPGLLLTEVSTPEGPVVFASDLIPGQPWVHLPICMGYDRYPELVIDEKKRLLNDLLKRGGLLFFTHDAEIACGRLIQSAEGRFGVSPVAL